MNIAAYDLSLTAPTGCINGAIHTLNTKKLKGHNRLEAITDWITGTVQPGWLVIIEGYAYARANQAHQIGELGGIVRHDLWRRAIPVLDIAPATLKKYATGKGNAGKEEVLSAAIRRGDNLFTGTSNDAADAWWLWVIGTDLTGDPAVQVPKVQRAAIADVELPVWKAAA